MRDLSVCLSDSRFCRRVTRENGTCTLINQFKSSFIFFLYFFFVASILVSNII